MNKLYIINFRLKNGFIISTFTSWNLETLKNKIANNPE